MATLVYSDSDGRDRSFALGSDPVTVGRAPECTIRSEDPRVSRMHARFFVDQGGLWIEDLGSTHGIYVGPNKVQRAPVPPGEVVLIGSLLVRLVPANGTMPPPIGLHGTLATWLDLERKNRVAVEEERDAFAKRVGELHQELAALRTKQEDAGETQPGIAAEAVRLRDEAEARAATLERALQAVQDELLVLRQTATGDSDEDVKRLRAELATTRDQLITAKRDLDDRAEWSTLVGAEHTKLSQQLDQAKLELEEARAAKRVAEQAASEALRESQTAITALESLRRQSTADLEAARAEVLKLREANTIAATSAGVAAAEQLAEMDIEIQRLKHELADAKTAPKPGPSESDARVQELTEQIAQLTARAEKAEKELSAAQIRAQGAERNLAHANTQAAKAETRVSQLEQQVADASAKAKGAEEEVAKARDRIGALEARVGAGDAPLQAAEQRATKIASELAAVKDQLETSRGRIVELESAVAAAQSAKRDADAKADTVRAEVAAAQQKLAEAEKRAGTLQAKLDDLSSAQSAIAQAEKTRDDAKNRVSAAEQQVAEAMRRADDAEKRATAADTMAKAMAKDVAEALRRAADADTKQRATQREVVELTRRAQDAEAKVSTADAAIQAAEARVAEAEARSETIRKELAEQLDAAQKELAAKLEATQKDLGAKLEAAQRELAAERKTSLALVDRKTHLERDLSEAKAALPAAVKRAEEAEARVAEHEVQLETLQDRIDDLESSIAVAETARQASLDESAEKIAALEKELAEQKQAAGKGGELVAELRAKVTDLEQRLATVEKERDEAREELRRAKEEMADLVRVAEQRAAATEEDKERLADALRRAADAERKADALATQAETADLAIGRASALQRQLDEALSKLAFLERESSRPRELPRNEISEAITNDRIAAAENRVKEIEAQLADAEKRAKSARDEAAHATDSLSRVQHEMAELTRRAQLAEEAIARANALEQRAAALDKRATSAEQMIGDAERRAGEAEAQIEELTARLEELESRPSTPAINTEAFERQLFDAQRRIAELEREVANADNVRSFAAETEREIAQLQRDLREARSKLTQITLERDRLETELRGLRDDSETTSRRAPLPRDDAKAVRDYDPEVTAQADLSKYEPIIAKATELQVRNIELEKTLAQLRAQLADTEDRLREAIDGRDDDDESEQTHTGSQLPIAFAEHLSVLEESIDSLRANMRAASDETAMMEQSDSVVAVSSAVSQAAEHIERARAAIRAMNSAMGM